MISEGGSKHEEGRGHFSFFLGSLVFPTQSGKCWKATSNVRVGYGSPMLSITGSLTKRWGPNNRQAASKGSGIHLGTGKHVFSV